MTRPGRRRRLFLMTFGIVGVLILSPAAAIFNVALGWLIFGLSTAALGVGAYDELFGQ